MSNTDGEGSRQEETPFTSQFSSFSQFGSAQPTTTTSTTAHWGFSPQLATEEPAEPVEQAEPVSDKTASITSGYDAFMNSPQVEKSTDSDSFLAEPSITSSQFDSQFKHAEEPAQAEEITFDDAAFDALNEEEEEEQAEPVVEEPSPEPEVIQPSPEVPETIAMTTPETIPQIIEETESTHSYLESPQSTSIEDARPASVDDNWEDVSVSELPAVITEAFAEAPVKKPIEASVEAPVEKQIEQVEESVEESVEEPKKTPKSPVKATPKSPVKTPAKAKAVAKPKSPAKTATGESEAVEGVRHSARQRKTVERLSIEPAAPAKENELVIPKGSGLKIGDIEVAAKAVNGKASSHKGLVLLHRILYDRIGVARERKAHIRAWCGVEGDATEGAKMLAAKFSKHTVAELKDVVAVLALPVNNDKSHLVEKLSSFLAKPEPQPIHTRAVVAAAKKARKPVAKGTNRTAAMKRAKSADNEEAEGAKPAKKSKTTAKKAAPKSKAKKASESPVKSFLTPETVDSDLDSDIEREVLEEIKNNGPSDTASVTGAPVEEAAEI